MIDRQQANNANFFSYLFGSKYTFANDKKYLLINCYVYFQMLFMYVVPHNDGLRFFYQIKSNTGSKKKRKKREREN
jgi:hypothetical protein